MIFTRNFLSTEEGRAVRIRRFVLHVPVNHLFSQPLQFVSL